MKRLIPILLTTIIVVSTSARADLIDQVSNLKDKALGRVSLICNTTWQMERLEHVLSPDSTYNIVLRVRKPQKIVKIERNANNKNYDESDGFSFRKIDDQYIYLFYDTKQQNDQGKREVFLPWEDSKEVIDLGWLPTPTILLDRYDGQMLLYQGPDTSCCLIVGKCKLGYLKAEKQF